MARTRVRRWPRAAAATAAALVAGFLLASAVGARAALAGSRAEPAVAPGQIGRSWEDVAFDSRDDHVALSGWLFHAARPSGRSIVLVHGWQGGREDADFVPLTQALLVRGYDVLMFDLRGSGRSAGDHQTFATDEPRDVLGAHDFLVRRGYRPGLMTVLGNSMGAASVIEAAPELDDVAAIVSDSAFADLSDTIAHGLTRFTGLPGAVALPALGFAGLYGIKTDLRPLDVVRALPHRAFLFVHSTGDPLIPSSDAEELAAASTDPDTRLLLIPGSDHLDTWTRAPDAYLAALLSFVDRMVEQRRDGGSGAPRGTGPTAQPGTVSARAAR